MRQRIIGGEFVVFGNLLHDSFFPARYGTSASPSLALRVVHDRSTSGEVLITQQRSPNRRVVRDLASWLEACNTYISVLVAHYPARALKLLAHQRNICDASSRFPADCWLSCMRCGGPIPDPYAGTASTTINGWSASLATLTPRDLHLST